MVYEFSEKNSKILFNGKIVEFSLPIYENGEDIYLPVKNIADLMKYETLWNDENQSITIYGSNANINTTIQIGIGKCRIWEPPSDYFQWEKEINLIETVPVLINAEIYISIYNTRLLFPLYIEENDEKGEILIEAAHSVYDEFSSFCLMPLNAKQAIIKELEPGGILSELDKGHFIIYNEKWIAYLTDDYYTVMPPYWFGDIADYMDKISQICPVMAYATSESSIGIMIINKGNIKSKLSFSYPENICEYMLYSKDARAAEFNEEKIEAEIENSIKAFNFEALKLMGYSEKEIWKIRQALDYKIYIAKKSLESHRLSETLLIHGENLRCERLIDMALDSEPWYLFLE